MLNFSFPTPPTHVLVDIRCKSIGRLIYGDVIHDESSGDTLNLCPLVQCEGYSIKYVLKGEFMSVV